MSIAPNVGALSSYFHRVRLHPKLWHAARRSSTSSPSCPAASARRSSGSGPQLKESLKAFWAPGLWWEELGWAVRRRGGRHDVRALRTALDGAFRAGRPVVVHIATVKGKGFAPAEDGGLEGMEQWHAAKPKSIANGAPGRQGGEGPGSAPSAPPPQYTKVFGERWSRRSAATAGSSASPPR
jgi:1-deoxy-D-xylulose-5-phosphate synthase